MQQQLVDERILARADEGRVPTIEPTIPDLGAKALVAKRCIDVLLASLGLIVVVPIGLIIVVVVKLTSRGPAFFVHERVGKGGMPIRVVKFRTMRDGTHGEVMGCVQQRHEYASNDFKLAPDDPRITKVGKHLRKTSIDELPQLYNVLRGEMSLVGIRPLLADELACRPEYDQRCYKLLPPGMTGLWQVMGRSTVGAHDRFALDRQYVEEWGIMSDIALLAKTPIAVLRVHHAN